MEHELTQGAVMVSLSDECNEGWFGDYDPKNRKDQRLLRMYVYKAGDGEWNAVDDSSYCTALPADSHLDAITEALQLIMWAVAPAVEAGISIKKCCRRLSWIGYVGKHADNDSCLGD